MINYYQILWEKNDIFWLDFVLNVIQNLLGKSFYIYKMASQFHLNLSCRSHLLQSIVQFQKISILPPQKGLEFQGVRGSVRPKNLKKCIFSGITQCLLLMRSICCVCLRFWLAYGIVWNASSLLAGLVLSFSRHVNDLRSIMKAYFDIEKQFRFWQVDRLRFDWLLLSDHL